VVFVTNLVPGDIADIKIKSRHKNYLTGYPVKIHKLSPKRITPFCEYFGICGGCNWQQLPYEEQLKYKQQQVADNLERIGKAGSQEISSIIPSVMLTNYRNKLEFAFSENRWFLKNEIHGTNESPTRKALGFHVPEMYNRVLDIKKCYLQDEPSNHIRNAIREYALEKNLDFFNRRKQQGFLRNLIIRNTSAGEWMVVLSFFRDEKEAIDGLMSYIAQKFTEITSLMYVINPKGNDTISDLPVFQFKGSNCITEKVDNLIFKIGPRSFFQPNTQLTDTLYKVVADLAGLKGNEVVYDLYTGIGAIAIYISRQCMKVIGIENIAEAVENARENAIINNIKNAEFITGDVKDILTSQFITEKGNPDTVIVDPPRSGIHKTVTGKLISLQPAKIVYVSCNTATQARDINLLSEKYKIKKVQPVDMFPHTHHIENIILLELI
jgi:23S rRNA (uracil1939-C5)-methyltransferase